MWLGLRCGLITMKWRRSRAAWKDSACSSGIFRISSNNMSQHTLVSEPDSVEVLVLFLQLRLNLSTSLQIVLVISTDDKQTILDSAGLRS